MRKGMIIDAGTIQPGDKLYYYDTTFALTGEAIAITHYGSSIKVTFAGGVELQTHAQHQVFAERVVKGEIRSVQPRHTTRKGSSRIVSLDRANGKGMRGPS